MKVILLCFFALLYADTAEMTCLAPYGVSLQFRQIHFCGGVILNENFIATAAHCVCYIEGIESISIVAGREKLSVNNGQRIDVTEKHIHPKYNNETYECDFAVLKLKSPLNFTEDVSCVKLCSTSPISSVSGFVSGWSTCKRGGNTNTTDDKFGDNTELQSNALCNILYSVPPCMICALYPLGGSDCCQGDSGGPVVNDNKFVGMVTYGRKCGNPRSPGFFIDTCCPVILSFIKDILGL